MWNICERLCLHLYLYMGTCACAILGTWYCDTLQRYVNNSRNLPNSRTQRKQGRNIPLGGTPDSDTCSLYVLEGSQGGAYTPLTLLKSCCCAIMVTPPRPKWLLLRWWGGVTPTQELLLQGGVYTPQLRISVAAAAPWSALPHPGWRPCCCLRCCSPQAIARILGRPY